MSNLPQQIFDQEFEDVGNIDEDIDNLFDKFILVIDNIRSIAESPPGGLQSNSNQIGIAKLKVDPLNYLESRIHAFYRLLGLPIVTGDKFYNPGYDPNPKTNLAKYSIVSAMNQETIVAMNLREQQWKSFSQMFKTQGLESTLFALVQLRTKPFNMLDTIKTKSIDGRNEIIDELKVNLSNLTTDIDKAVVDFSNRMGFGLDSVRHLIKPFTVNPSIEFTVMPDSHKICVPFLPDLKSTRISANPNIFLLRPGIEFILRARLKDNNPDPLFLTDIQKIINQEKSPNPSFSDDIDSNLLRSTIEALVNDNKINNEDVFNSFSTFTNTQVIVSRQLIKTLKIVLYELHKAIEEIEKIKKKITFLPIPDPSGFDKGGKLKESQPTTKLERDLVTLTIKKLNAEREIEIEKGLGDFATSGFVSLEKVNTYSQQIEELTHLKNDLGNRGLKCLRTIEIITGEGSGLGLIDILSIYTALWTINIEYLLGLLDQDSIDRLYKFNPGLQTTAVVERKNGGGKSVIESLNALEQKVNNILSFADLTFARTFISPSENEGGDPT